MKPMATPDNADIVHYLTKLEGRLVCQKRRLSFSMGDYHKL